MARAGQQRGGLLDAPYRLLIRTSLALALGIGFALGVYLIIGFGLGLPLSAATPALMQVHGQAQLFGFVALYIIAVGVQLFPRFHANPLRRPRQVSVGGLLLGLGIVLRTLGQPMPPDAPLRGPGLILAALSELVGALLVVHAFGQVVLGSVQRPRGGFAAVLPATLGSSLLLGLLLNVYLAFGLAQGALVVPGAQDEALLHLQLWGFAGSMVLLIAGRVYPRFLLLRPAREGVLRWALVLWAIGSLGVPLVWLGLPGVAWLRTLATAAQLGGALGYVVGLRLYEAPLRASGMPHVTNPTRRWARIAFAFLLVGAAIDLGTAVADALGGTSVLTQLSAGRHALAQGFLLPVMVYMAARILPGYSGLMMRRERQLAILIWALFAGAALRVGGELVGGYAPGWGALVALGGLLAAAVFVHFAIGLWRATGRAPGS
jgi:hypothetical protein